MVCAERLRTRRSSTMRLRRAVMGSSFQRQNVCLATTLCSVERSFLLSRSEATLRFKTPLTCLPRSGFVQLRLSYARHLLIFSSGIFSFEYMSHLACHGGRCAASQRLWQEIPYASELKPS